MSRSQDGLSRSRRSRLQEAVVDVDEQLSRLHREDLAARLLAIGHVAARRMSPETKQRDHGRMLYDERGLPA
jgi:antitoxin VapB